MIDYNKLHSDGYAHIRIEDLIPSEKLEEFNTMSDIVCDIPYTAENYTYIMCVLGKHNDPEWPMQVSLDERESRLSKLKELEMRVTQRWGQSCFRNSDENQAKVGQYFRNLVKSFIRDFYPEIKEDYSNLHFQDNFTEYEDGDFTDSHRDGQNIGRLCVILMYLTPEEEYVDGGGELYITGEAEQSTVELARIKPVRGNIAMLEFDKHNPFHGVDPVKNGFHRHCYLSFMWNTDKMPDDIRPKGYS